MNRHRPRVIGLIMIGILTAGALVGGGWWLGQRSQTQSAASGVTTAPSASPPAADTTTPATPTSPANAGTWQRLPAAPIPGGSYAGMWTGTELILHASYFDYQVERLEGDFDGDGFIDLAISVPFEDVATARDAGAVSVLYGSAGGLTAAGGQAFWQGTGGAAGTAEAGDQFGFSLASGDLNGDGFVDLAIGVPFGDIGSAVDSGVLSVLYGSAAGLSPTGSQAFWQGSGGAAGTAERLDLFGFALATGSFGGGGAADLAIGSPLEDVGATPDAGAVTALYGSAGGLTSGGSQAFWQGTGGVAGTAEAGDLLGSGFVGGDPSAGPSTAGTVHGRRRANASGLTGDRSSTS